MKIDPARPLSADEHAVLSVLLEPEFSGVEQLRAQIRGARVVGQCDCGCPTIDIEVAADAPSAALTGRLSPVEAQVSSDGDDPPGEILLFLENGRLSSMEYVFYTDQPPDRWPTRNRLRTVELRR